MEECSGDGSDVTCNWDSEFDIGGVSGDSCVATFVGGRVVGGLGSLGKA